MFAEPSEAVHLFGVESQQQAMALIRDSVTKEFRMPIFGETTKATFRKTYRSISPEFFDMLWPNYWGMQTSVWAGSIASFDSGVLPDHPGLQHRVYRMIDYTGEGPEDENGHGTICAILSLMSQPYRMSLLSIKIARRDGTGNRDDFLRALNDLARLKSETQVTQNHFEGLVGEIGQAHLRCGVYTTRFGGLRSCDGTCDVCKAAECVCASGIEMQVSVGNIPGKTACPATLAIKRNVPHILALSDLEATVG